MYESYQRGRWPSKLRCLLVAVVCSGFLAGCGAEGPAAVASAKPAPDAAAEEPREESMPSEKIEKTEQQWREELTPEQFHILREKGTERAFSGKYWDTKTEGTYACAGCGQPLYSSETKYKSGTGWPSFWKPISPDAIATRPDRSWFTTRTEVVCSRCGGHLGHVFDDGPEPTGKRHCLNSAALKLVATGEEQKD